jgi:hypothetical protein
VTVGLSKRRYASESAVPVRRQEERRVNGESSRTPYPDRDPGLFYELARDRLAMQLGSIDALDSKIGLLISLASGLMGLLAAVFALRGEQPDSGELALIGVATLVYLVASGIGIRVYFCRSWKLGPDLRQVWDALWGEDDDRRLKWDVANSFWSFYEKNRSGQRTKEDALPFILIAVVIQTLLVVLALFLVTQAA